MTKLDSALRRLETQLAGLPPEQAESALRRQLRAAPRDVAALYRLGLLNAQHGRLEPAESLAARAVELAPQFNAARHLLAATLLQRGKPGAARPHAERMVAREPGNASCRTLLAAILAALGDFDRALRLYEALTRELPRDVDLWLRYGYALRSVGRRADSARAFRACIDLAPTFGEPRWALVNVRPEAASEAEIEALRSLLAGPGLTGEDRVNLHYALGRALEQCRNHEASFAHYAEGARLRRAGLRYDAEQTTLLVRRATGFFTPAFFAARAGAGCADPAPIFIIGLPRAGSTLIEQILASHSAVEGTKELPEIIAIAGELGWGKPDSLYPENLASLAPAEITALGARYIHATRPYRASQKPFFVDKMPGNWLHVGLIRTILPNAKIIDARRDPVATCFAAFKQLFTRFDFSYDLTDLGRYYNDYTTLMDHFGSVTHRVAYESLVENTEMEIRRLLDFCNLPFEPACLRFWENPRAVHTISAEQVRQPIFRQSLDQWRHYEPWLGPLKAALAEPNR